MDLGVAADTGGTVACPVCTLYLREGMSLHRHLDTHPKEQVIEALIKASGPSNIPLDTSQIQVSGVPQVSQTLQSTPPQPQFNGQGASTAAATAHIPTQSTFPLGPVFECPPINAMMPPQFASFSYQQFVNNGTMMVPQYAMASPQANQMMQMLYNPYMYQQPQIPTVQMISPVSTIPTTRIRPVVTVTNTDTTARSVIIPTHSTNDPKQILPEIMASNNVEMILPDMEPPASPVQSTVPQTVEERNEQDDSSETLLDIQEQRTQNTMTRRIEIDEIHSSNVGETVNCQSTTAEEEKSLSILPEPDESDQQTTAVDCTAHGVIEPAFPKQQQTQCLRFSPTYEDEANNENNSNTNKRPSPVTTDMDGLLCQESNLKKEESKQCQHGPGEAATKSTTPGTTGETSQQRTEVEHLERLLMTMIETELVGIKENDEKVQDKDRRQSASNAKSSTPVSMEDKNNSIESNDDNVDNESVELCSGPSKIDDKSIIDETEFDNTYRYKNSVSCPPSPIIMDKPTSAVACLARSEYGSIENLNLYPVGFEATALDVNMDHEDEEDDDEDDDLHDKFAMDHFDDGDMEVDDLASAHTSKDHDESAHVRSHTPLSTISGISGLRVRTDLSKPCSPVSIHSFVNTDVDSHDEDSNDSDLEHENEKDPIHCGSPVSHSTRLCQEVDEKMTHVDRKIETDNENYHQSVITEHVTSFPAISSQQQATIHETFAMSNSKMTTNPSNLGVTQISEPTTSVESKSFQSTTAKSASHLPSTELLNINEDAHSGPMNVFEFDGLQILVPSTFISESSQKAISAMSQQSMASSEGGVGIDEEVKSVNMRADETMPPRGELSEQESNGCTEHSAWQLYVGQESSRMSTSYDLMARESWEESEGSDNEAGVPLLDSRSLATHFTSSLFLDRDRNSPTKHRTFKCSQCNEVFDCPKERRVHSTTVHKDAGPSNSSSNSGPIEQSETKDIKLLDGRMNPFEDIFVPGFNASQNFHHHQHPQQHHLHLQQQQQQPQQQQQQPQLHQMQPPEQPGDIGKAETDEKTEGLAASPSVDVSCAMCTQKFSSERSLQAHNRRVHGTEVARRLHDISKCQICQEEFASVALFNTHLKIHPLECSQCGKYFYRKQNFKLHVKRHLGIKPFPCTVCDKAFLTKQKLDEHMNGHTGNAPVKCNLCNETFRRYSNLTQHKNRHHLNIKRKLKDYICHCGEVFHTKKKLAWHKETHDEKPKACTYCNERFIHMASLTRHMRRAHNRRFVPDAQRENENVECPICKCIYLRSSLSVHMRVHNGERPYECQVCSKAFSTKWNLQLHKWTHAARSTKPFKCNQCSAAFYRHSDYTAHMNSHRNVRPYTCNYCGAQFIRKYNCLRHVKEHEENKAYTCDVCNKTFHRSYYLKEHLRVHSGARPYTCHICGKSSSTKSNHNKHVRIHHAREPVNTEN